MIKKKLIIGIILVLLFIVVIAVLGLVFFDWFNLTGAVVYDENEIYNYTYNGPGGNYIFTVDNRTDNVFHIIHYNANLKPYAVPFHYGPKELRTIPMESGLMDKIVYDTSKGKTGIKKLIYITMEPGMEEKTEHRSTVALLTIARITGQNDAAVYYIQTQGASNEKIEGVPYITCDDASWGTGVIEFRLGDENKIYSEGDCVILEAVDGEGLVKVGERLTYLLLKVYSDN